MNHDTYYPIDDNNIKVRLQNNVTWYNNCSECKVRRCNLAANGDKSVVTPIE